MAANTTAATITPNLLFPFKPSPPSLLSGAIQTYLPNVGAVYVLDIPGCSNDQACSEYQGLTITEGANMVQWTSMNTVDQNTTSVVCTLDGADAGLCLASIGRNGDILDYLGTEYTPLQLVPVTVTSGVEKLPPSVAATPTAIAPLVTVTTQKLHTLSEAINGFTEAIVDKSVVPSTTAVTSPNSAPTATSTSKGGAPAVTAVARLGGVMAALAVAVAAL